MPRGEAGQPKCVPNLADFGAARNAWHHVGAVRLLDALIYRGHGSGMDHAEERAMEFGIFNLMGSRDAAKPTAEVFAEVAEQTRLADSQ